MKKLLCTVAMVGALAIPGAAQAQVSVGAGGGFHDDFDFGLFGFASFAVPQLEQNLSIVPSFGFYFPDGGDAWELNGDVLYSFPVGDDVPVVPYAMAGLNILSAGPDGGNMNTDIGLNLGGGIQFRAETVNPFVGAKFEIQDGTGFLVYGGVGFPLG